IMTSNLGASEMNGLVEGGMGFSRTTITAVDGKLDDKISRTAVEAARRKFTPEFMNRIDKVVVFKTLRPEHMQQILEIELGMVQQPFHPHRRELSARLRIAVSSGPVRRAKRFRVQGLNKKLRAPQAAPFFFAAHVGVSQPRSSGARESCLEDCQPCSPPSRGFCGPTKPPLL